MALSKKLETKRTLLDEHTGGSGKIIKEMPVSVASGTSCTIRPKYDCEVFIFVPCVLISSKLFIHQRMH
jgi:hypothetical protein